MQASKLHENGMGIAAVRRNLEDLLAQARAANAPNWSQYELYRDEYDTHLRECPFNHELIDFKRFEVNYRHDPAFCTDGKPRIRWVEAQSIKLRYLLSAAWLSFTSLGVVARAVGVAGGGSIARAHANPLGHL